MAERKGLMARAGKALKAALDMGPPAGVLTPPTDEEMRNHPTNQDTMAAEYQVEKLVEWFEGRFNCAYGPASGQDLRYQVFALATPRDDGAWVRLAREMRTRFAAVPEGTTMYWRLPEKIQALCWEPERSSDPACGYAWLRIRASVDVADSSVLPIKEEFAFPERI